MQIPFVKQDPLATGAVEELGGDGPRIRRIRCGNPGPFTYLGTNSYLIGEGRVALLDPGPVDEAHQAALLAALDPGERITHILVSHTHRDHSPGAAPLVAATGAVTAGFGPHGTPGFGGDLDFDPAIRLADGETLRGEGWAVTALHTPGHCANHLCFALEGSDALFTADHVMSWSSSVVSPPDGNMTDYMASLEKLAGRGEARFLPGHGAPAAEPGRFARALLLHRQAREAKVLEALREAGDAPLEALVTVVYGGLEPRLLPAAGRSLLAHLQKLEAEGLAAQQESRWLAA